MRKFFRPASIVFYVLAVLLFFVVGLFYAVLIEAGKNQGLAAGAIVFGYGVAFGGVAFVVSLIAAYFMEVPLLKKLNWLLLALFLIGTTVLVMRGKKRIEERKKAESALFDQQKTPEERPGVFIPITLVGRLEHGT